MFDRLSSQGSHRFSLVDCSWTNDWENPNENSLPICRVEKLVRLIAATHSMHYLVEEVSHSQYQRSSRHGDRVFFYMYKLCEPSHPELSTRGLSCKCTMCMRCWECLVFDAKPMSSAAECSSEEINMQIKCSPRIGRIYTIQEVRI